MEIEAVTEVVAIDPAVLDGGVISVDPVLPEPIAISDPAPTDPAPTDPAPTDPASTDGTTDLPPPDAETFGGPVVVIAVDHVVAGPVAVGPVAVDPATEGTPGAGTPADGADGTATDGQVPADAYTDYFPIDYKDPATDGSDGTTQVIYTMTGGDPVVYATAETPSRGAHDPLPFERTTTASHVDVSHVEIPHGAAPESAPIATLDIDPDIAAIHYAAADTSHTGLHLL